MLQIKLKSKVIASALLLTANQTAWAAGSGGHGSITDLGWYFFNFTAYLTLTYFLTRKPIAKAWQARHHKIYNLVNAAQIELEAAKKKLAKAEQEQSSLATRIAAMQENHDKSVAQEKDQLINNNQQQIEAVIKQGELLIEAEKNASIQEVEKELSIRVLQKAETLLKEEFSKEQDDKYRSKLNENLKSLRAN